MTETGNELIAMALEDRSRRAIGKDCDALETLVRALQGEPLRLSLGQVAQAGRRGGRDPRDSDPHCHAPLTGLGSSSLGYSACHSRRKLPAIGREIAAPLRNLPSISFVIQHTVNSTSPKSLLWLRDYLGSFGLGASEVLVDIFHVNLHHKPRRCHHLVRVSSARRRDAPGTAVDYFKGISCGRR